MTTSQTIDGVPRGLLENFASYAEGSASSEVQLWVKKLRALLDAPTPTPVPAAWMRFNDDQKAIFTRGKRSNNSEPLYPHPTAYRVPAAQHQGDTPDDDKSHPRFIAGYTAGLHDHKLGQPQGEPVAHTMKSVMSAICGIEGFPMLTSNQCHALAAKLNTEQTAPVAVSLPDRLQEILTFLDGSGTLDGYSFGDVHTSRRKFWWRNELRACLDELKRLNPSL